MGKAGECKELYKEKLGRDGEQSGPEGSLNSCFHLSWSFSDTFLFGKCLILNYFELGFSSYELKSCVCYVSFVASHFFIRTYHCGFDFCRFPLLSLFYYVDVISLFCLIKFFNYYYGVWIRRRCSESDCAQSEVPCWTICWESVLGLWGVQESIRPLEGRKGAWCSVQRN